MPHNLKIYPNMERIDIYRNETTSICDYSKKIPHIMFLEKI